MSASEMALDRAREIVAEVVRKMPADDLKRWLAYCAERGAEVTVEPDGELYEIRCGGAPLVLVPQRVLTDPEVTAFSVLGQLPAVPDDISQLEES